MTFNHNYINFTFHFDSNEGRRAGLLTSSILNLPYLFYQIIFPLFSKSGRRPVKWWRSVQIPCWYEKAIFCFTETKTYYRYLKFLTRNNYNLSSQMYCIVCNMYSFFICLAHMSVYVQCLSLLFISFYPHVVWQFEGRNLW